MRRGPSIGRMLVGLNAFVLLVPVLALVLMQIYESHLVEQTERRLIGEAAVVGETYRSLLFDARGTSSASDRILPSDAALWSVKPIADISRGYAPPAPEPTTREKPAEPASLVAGARMKSILDRVKRLNLSSVRVVDNHGCVVASTSDDGDKGDDVCIDNYPEVAAALGGRYHAVVRERHTDYRMGSRPDPLRRFGDNRVFIALPIFQDGAVIGVVRMARTSLNTVEALWRHRRTLVWAGLACLLLTLGVSWYLTRTIGRPMRMISDAAKAIAKGQPRTLSPAGTVPAEVADMSASLDEMTEQLRARAAYVREFAATASHELKTPIAAIRGATELLSESWEDMSAAQRERFLSNIDADGARMQVLVTRMLELARIENATHEESAPESFDAAVVVRGVVPGAVEVLGPEAGLAVSMRQEHFEMAVRNLVDNAMTHGGAPVSVVMSAGPGERQTIEVRDCGEGVSEGNRARIFERFFTTRRDDGGTGLGLAIVRAIAERRGGSLTYVRDGAVSIFRMII